MLQPFLISSLQMMHIFSSKASKESGGQMLQILKLFEQVSGQMINKEKSSVFF